MSLMRPMPVEALDPDVPARIGNYEVMAVLGRGQSATIYLGRELFPARQVALKVYDPEMLKGEDGGVFRALFLKETMLARKLAHPNICQVYDAAADDQRAYIVMEYAPEGNLDRYCVPEGLLPPQRVAEILERVCDALSYANTHGVIHRDLKPANILMGGDGEAKVADFGVALTNLAFDQTRGMMVGSPAYMAPEQVERKAASMKSDIYALGIVLYKMLVGGLPFPPESAAALATRILLGNLPLPSAARAGLHPGFDEIFRRCTARDPDHRYANWEQLAADLRSIALPNGEATDAGSRKSIMRGLPFFRGFSDAALEEVAPMGRWFDLRAGTQLLGEDDPGYSFFILVRGQMRVTRKGTLLAIRGAGECLGETSFLRRSGQRRFRTIEAVTDCAVIEFDPDLLWLASPVCMRHFHEAFLAAMAERLTAAEGALSELLAEKNVELF